MREKLLPREKFLKLGIDGLMDVDLIAAILGTGTKNSDVLDVSGKVVASIKKQLFDKSNIDVEELTKISGVGNKKALQVLAGIELGKRLYGGYQGKKTLKCTEDAVNLVRGIENKKQEHLVVIYLNARYELLGKRTVGIGTLNKLEIVPRDLIIPALELNCAAMILVHNHPSGDCIPSEEDISMTKRIRDASEIVGIVMLDHIVVAKNGWKVIEQR